MVNCISVYLEGDTVYCYYVLQLLAARLPELAVSRLERLDCFHWIFPKHWGEYQSKLSTDHLSGERI